MITSSTMRYQTVNPTTGQIGTTLTCITGTGLKRVADAVSESHTRWRAEIWKCLPMLTAQANTTAFTGRYEGRQTAMVRLCQLLSIEVPIVQAPIGHASGPELVAAVCATGALGMLSVTWREVPEIRRVIRGIRDRTERPFGVNLVLEQGQDARLDACLEEGVRIVSFFWGNPAPYLDRVHQAGAVVMHTVGSAAEARQRADDGVDVIVTQGAESGGHVWGRVSTMALVPAVVDAVGPVPVIAAGGIADARGIAAAMALGASGVWMGTRFVATLESSAHPVYKHAVLEAAETDTIYTTVFDGGWPDAPHRVLRNSTTARTESGAGGPADRPGAGEVIAHFADGTPVIRYAADEPLAGMDGEVEAMALYAGQSAALVHDVPSASALVPSLMNQSREALSNALSRLQDDPAPPAADGRGGPAGTAAAHR